MEEDTVIGLRKQEEESGFDILTDILRKGAKRLLAQAIEAEISDYLCRYKDERLADGKQAVVRNGYLRDCHLNCVKAYLASAGDLDSLTRRKSVELRRYSAASQKLEQTTLVVTDRVQLVRAAQAKFVRQAQAAQKNLADAEKILKSLKASERKTLLAAQKRANAKEYANSKSAAKSYKGASGRAGKAIKYAFSQIGDRYVFGAAGMTTWDCSGLTMRAFASAGVSIPHSSRAQFRYGRKVSRSQLQPGDLVFFKSPISHVGIYIGGGRMVHAPRPGQAVKIAPINQMRFAGAVRL